MKQPIVKTGGKHKKAKKGMPTKTPKSVKLSKATAAKNNGRPVPPAHPVMVSNSADAALAQLVGGSNG